jgi:hypothetical protein
VTLARRNKPPAVRNIIYTTNPSGFRPTLGGRSSPSRQGLSRQLAQKLAEGDPSRRYRSGSSERSAPDGICDLCRCGARFSLIESHAPNAGCITAANFGELAGRVGRGSWARSYPGRRLSTPLASPRYGTAALDSRRRLHPVSGSCCGTGRLDDRRPDRLLTQSAYLASSTPPQKTKSCDDADR